MTTHSIRPSRARAISIGMAVLSLFATPNIAVGQTPRDGAMQTWLASRQELDSLAAVADREATDTARPFPERARSESSATAIRARLRDGDFHVGDRLVIWVRGETALSDTFPVRDGLVLKLPNLRDVVLTGVLRSEVTARVAERVGEYFRDREVRVLPLVNIGVLGQVMRPGYYQFSADIPLSDALMAAGGLTPAAGSDRIIVRRGARTLWKAEKIREMLAVGATLTELGLHSGDDIVVEEPSKRDWGTISQIGAALSGIVVTILYATRR